MCVLGGGGVERRKFCRRMLELQPNDKVGCGLEWCWDVRDWWWCWWVGVVGVRVVVVVGCV